MMRQKIKIFLKYLKLGSYLRAKGLKFDQVLDDATASMNKRPNKIPKVSLEEIIPGSITAKICEKETEDGNVSLSELLCIVSMVKHFKVNKIFEIGTFNGRTTLNIHQNCVKEPKIYTLDLPATDAEKTVHKLHDWEKTYTNKTEPGRKFSHLRDDGSIVQLLGDSAKFGRQDLNNYFDFIFVDGSHTAKYVANDSELALRLVKKEKGIIVWHDYDTEWDGVTNTMENFYANDQRFKDIKSIKETSLLFLRK
mgnify:CR=1 FL=1